MIDKVVYGMAGLRLLSGAIELTAAILMLKFGRVEAAFKINALLALIGPMILLTVTGLGLVGLVGRISPAGMLLVLSGVALIFLGINHM